MALVRIVRCYNAPPDCTLLVKPTWGIRELPVIIDAVMRSGRCGTGVDGGLW